MQTIKLLLVMLFSIVIAACGGGGGGGGSSPPPAATFSISGTVSGAVTGGVTINLTGASAASFTTDATGNYSFTGLANGSYTVTPSLAGNTFAPAGMAVTVSGANVVNPNFVATALGGGASTYSISGTVSGAASSGVKMDLGAAGSVFTTLGGTYSIAGLPAGSYTVTPSLAGFTFSPANKAVMLTTASSMANDFTATAVVVPHSLSGNVSGVTGGLVTIDVTGAATASITTDANGNYTVPGLFDGTYNVAPSKTGYTFAPNSTSVTMAGANVTAPSFTGTANSTVLATVNGAVTGAWVEGITITMSGCASGTTTSNASGAYSFANVPSGTTCTFTPTALTGYNYTNGSATIPAGSNAAVTASNIVASSKVASTSISGTVTNNSGKTGRIYILAYDNNCTGCAAVASTSIASAGAYQIRGLLGSNNYRVDAYVDVQGTGMGNASNPISSVLAGSGGGGVNITITPPTLTPAAFAPTGFSVFPSSGATFVAWDATRNAANLEMAAAYKIRWGTTNAVNGGSVVVIANDNGFYVHSGLANGAVMYYQISSCVSSTCAAGTESPLSAVVGPITINAPTAGNTVSGTVTVTPGITAAPLIVGLYNDAGIYFTRIANASSAQAYTITGVPNGSYANFAFIDRDNNGIGNGYVSAGDITNIGTNIPRNPVNGNVTNSNITLSSANATARIATNHEGANYSLGLKVFDGGKHAVAATVISGANIPMPLDIGVDPSNDGVRMWLGGTRPVVGDSYKIRVTYSDGTTQDITSSVTAVLDSFATSLVAQTSAPGTPAIPLFTWAAPASPPAAFNYRVELYNNTVHWWLDNPLPSSATSVLYNVDGRATVPSLPSGIYTWNVIVRDSNFNQATTLATYTVP